MASLTIDVEWKLYISLCERLLTLPIRDNRDIPLFKRLCEVKFQTSASRQVRARDNVYGREWEPAYTYSSHRVETSAVYIYI